MRHQAPPKFTRRVQALARCLPNVYIAPGEFDLDRHGHDQNRGHLECMKTMQRRDFLYLLILQVNSRLLPNEPFPSNLDSPIIHIIIFISTSCAVSRYLSRTVYIFVHLFFYSSLFLLLFHPLCHSLSFSFYLHFLSLCFISL